MSNMERSQEIVHFSVLISYQFVLPNHKFFSVQGIHSEYLKLIVTVIFLYARLLNTSPHRLLDSFL